MFGKRARASQVLPLLALLSLVATTTAVVPPDISPEAKTYLEHALDLMQQNALNRSSIDWTQLRQQTLAHAEGTKTTFDTYPAIQFALTQLKEHHSFLRLPDSMSADQQKSIYTEMMKIKGEPASSTQASPSPFLPQKAMLGHIDRRGGKVFAHVVVPMCIPQYTDWQKNGPDFQQFADKLHGIVMDLQAQKPEGWIIDLRGNGGGNMWPMLAGIGAVLGEGDAGAFESPDGSKSPWFYKAGRAGTHSQQGPDTISAYVNQTPFILPGLPWVAVLLDRGTASSGEAIAISFAGRTHERSFGEPTAGFSTSNQMYPLSDGASLFLCAGIELDRTGRRYPGGIDPDVQLPAPDSRPTEEEKDVVVQAAEDWLASQTAAAP
jgi:carboxyl-terminal processing protease